jgi:hypothetical protein
MAARPLHGLIDVSLGAWLSFLIYFFCVLCFVFCVSCFVFRVLCFVFVLRTDDCRLYFVWLFFSCPASCYLTGVIGSRALWCFKPLDSQRCVNRGGFLNGGSGRVLATFHYPNCHCRSLAAFSSAAFLRAPISIAERVCSIGIWSTVMRVLAQCLFRMQTMRSILCLGLLVRSLRSCFIPAAACASQSGYVLAACLTVYFGTVLAVY